MAALIDLLSKKDVVKSRSCQLRSNASTRLCVEMIAKISEHTAARPDTGFGKLSRPSDKLPAGASDQDRAAAQRSSLRVQAERLAPNGLLSWIHVKHKHSLCQAEVRQAGGRQPIAGSSATLRGEKECRCYFRLR